jgi:hypothetical protein
MMLEDFEVSYGSLSPLKRKREEDSQRKIKTQKLSNSLSSKLARSLSFTEDESNGEGESLNTQQSSLNSSNLFHRNFKHCSRRVFGGKCIKQPAANNDNTCDMEIINDHSMNDLSGGEDKLIHEPARVQMLRRILSHSSNEDNYWNVSMTDWLELQAQKRNIPLIEFQTQFQERSRDMEASLNILNSIPNNYNDIQVLIDRFLLNADWLKCDYYKPFIVSQKIRKMIHS